MQSDLEVYESLIELTISSTYKMLEYGGDLLEEDICKSIFSSIETDLLPFILHLKGQQPSKNTSERFMRFYTLINNVSKMWEEFVYWKKVKLLSDDKGLIKKFMFSLRDVQFNIYIINAWLLYNEPIDYWINRFESRKKKQEKVDYNYYYGG